MDEKYYVAIGMKSYGGGFVKKLGEALQVADEDNTQRIKEAFEHYWAEYLKRGIEIDGK